MSGDVPTVTCSKEFLLRSPVHNSKLDHKLLEAEHQRAHEREQHEFQMLQMYIMADGQRATSAASVTQSTQPHFEGLGLMDELNSDILPGVPGPSTHSHYSI
jgi:hypothetical protein